MSDEKTDLDEFGLFEKASIVYPVDVLDNFIKEQREKYDRNKKSVVPPLEKIKIFPTIRARHVYGWFSQKLGKGAVKGGRVELSDDQLTKCFNMWQLKDDISPSSLLADMAEFFIEKAQSRCDAAGSPQVYRLTVVERSGRAINTMFFNLQPTKS